MKRSGMSWSATAECGGGACKGGKKNTTRSVAEVWRFFVAACLALASMFFPDSVNEEGIPLYLRWFMCGGTVINNLYRLNKNISPKIRFADFGDIGEIEDLPSTCVLFPLNPTYPQFLHLWRNGDFCICRGQSD